MTEEYRFNSYNEAMKAVKGDGGKLRFVRPDLITYEMALEAVKECGLALEFVPIQLQDYGVIFAALKRTQKPKKFIKDQKAFNDFREF